MVSITAKGVHRQRRRAISSVGVLEIWVILILVCLFAGYSIVSIYSFSSSSDGGSLASRKGPLIRKEDQERGFAANASPSLHLVNEEFNENQEFFDNQAYDIVQMLDCPTLLAGQTPLMKRGGYVYGHVTNPNVVEESDQNTARRLDAIDYESGDEVEEDFSADDGSTFVTGAHLFCDYVSNRDSSDTFWKQKLKCDAKPEDLLDLWSNARAEFSDGNQLVQTLELIVERFVLLGSSTSYNVWAPIGDDATTYMTDTLNDQIREGTRIAALQENLGEGRLYVDVGSGLGYSALVITQLYPGTDIVSIEPSPQNWLMQRLNFICNSEKVEKQPLTILHAGVGSSTGTFQLANFVWRPTQTTSTRGWVESDTDETEDLGKAEDDVEFTVRLWPWHKLLTMAEISTRTIDVLNLDCEGCEYNLMPALKDEEFFEDIRTCMGELHWSYIPKLKRPSSKRAETTHGRLCQHEDFARQAMECCAFPDAIVKASVSGEVLAKEDNIMESVTVKDLIGETLCTDFPKWAEEHNLFAIESDWAWLQVNAMSSPSK